MSRGPRQTSEKVASDTAKAKADAGRPARDVYDLCQKAMALSHALLVEDRKAAHPKPGWVNRKKKRDAAWRLNTCKSLLKASKYLVQLLASGRITHEEQFSVHPNIDSPRWLFQIAGSRDRSLAELVLGLDAITDAFRAPPFFCARGTGSYGRDGRKKSGIRDESLTRGGHWLYHRKIIDR